TLLSGLACQPRRPAEPGVAVKFAEHTHEPLGGQGRMWRKTHLVSADAKMLRILGQCRAPALECGTERRLRDAVGKRDGMVENRPVLVIQPGAAEQLRTVPVGENLLIGRFPVPFLARKPGV